MPFSWFRTKAAPSRKARNAAPKPRYRKCLLELLEDRTMPAPVIALVDRPGDFGMGSSTPTSIEGDIRYVLSLTNTAFYAGSTIQFDTTKTGPTITLSGLGELKISQNTTITGPGATSLTIDGNAGNMNGVSTNMMGTRVFNITAQNIDGVDLRPDHHRRQRQAGAQQLGQPGRRHLQQRYADAHE